MKLRAIIYFDIILSAILSVALMLRGLFTQGKLTCGILSFVECGLKQWFTQVLILYAALFIIILVIFSVFMKKRRKKDKIIKEKKVEKLPIVGKDIEIHDKIGHEKIKIKI
jgi:type II secretory pathway component PulF